jgi:hypothetical protein
MNDMPSSWLGVLLETVAQGRHDQARLLLGEHGPGGIVLGGKDEDLVDAAGAGLGEDRAAVGHDEGLVTLEGGIQIGHHPDQPVPGGAVGLEGRRGGLLVAGTERTGALVLVHPGCPGDEGVRSLGATGAHDDPAARQRVQP